MSFASEVKEEVIRLDLNENQRKARLSAVIQLLASVSISSSGLSINFKTSSASLIKMVSMDIKEIYQCKSEITVEKQTNLNKRNLYGLSIVEKTKEILNDLDLWTDKGIQEHPRLMFLKNDDMIRAYLAGCFIACGSINSPRTTDYHLEIKANSVSFGQFLIKLLEKFYITAKLSHRRNTDFIYVKSSEKIADFLKLIGANEAIIQFEDIRIQRDYVNNLYRLDNIEIANAQKSQEVADKQIEAVEYLLGKDLLKYLSDKDREIALLRLKNPDASLKELAQLYEDEGGDSLSKSGIRHRFEKIFALKEKYQKEKEQ